MKTKIILIICLFFLASSAFFFAPLPAMASYEYKPMEKIPGFENASHNLPDFLQNLYKFAIWTVGIAALLMITIGGFFYFAAAGNTSKTGKGKEIIADALLGLIIAMAAWLILYVINPDLVDIKITLSPIKLKQFADGSAAAPKPPSPAPPPPVQQPTSCPNPPEAIKACCPSNANIKCGDCSSCLMVTGVNNKGCGLSKCFLNQNLLSKIQNIQGVTGWRITESWPPTVNHISRCHQDGTCADLNNSGGPTDPATIKKYYDAFRAAGLKVLYESKNCEPYRKLEINCNSYPTMTNLSSFHVYL